MPFPAGLPTTLLIFTGTNPAGGGPASGTVEFQPNVPSVHVEGYGRTFSGAGKYKFNTDGALADALGAVGVRLLDCDVPGTNPKGWLWLAIIEITGAPKRVLYFHLSVDQEEADLSEVQELNPGSPQYIPVIGPQGVQGEKGDKGDQGEVGDAGGALLVANNLTDLASPAAARTALGLGTAATQASGSFDAAGAAAGAQSAATAAAAADATTKAGTAQTAATSAAAADATSKVATHTGATDPHGDRTWAGGQFDPAGAAATAQAAAAAYTDTAVADEADRADAAYDAGGTAAAALDSANAYADAGDASTLTAANTYTDNHAGGGGGVVPIPYDDPIGAGIIVLTATSTWTPVVGSNGVHVRRVIPAAAGDLMEFGASFLWTGNVFFLDGVIRAADGSVARFISSGGPVANTEGYAPWYTQSPASFPSATASRWFTVQEGELDTGGMWTIEMVYRGPGISDGSNRLYFGDDYNGFWTVVRWPVGA